MKVKRLKEILEDIIDANGEEVDIIFETPRGTYMAPDDDATWYEEDGDAICIEIKAI